MTLRVDQLQHEYASPAGDARAILQGQTWQLAPGQQLLIRGISGSGKTTLFNILAGLLHPTSGAVYFGDQSLYALPEAARDRFRAQHLGYIFQTHHLIGALTALENVVMPMAFARVLPASQWRGHAQQLLDQVGIGEYSHALPRRLSTGQRLRVAVARALANRPRVVLADEPTAALDVEASDTVMTFLQQTCREMNAILIVASHDPTITTRFAHNADLKQGHLKWNEAQTV